MNISREFPGGNIIFHDFEDNTVTLAQDNSDTSKWWFWWGFCIVNPPNKELIFKFTDGSVVGPFGPAISDDGINWYFDKSSFVSHTEFRYNFNDCEKKYFAFSLAYTVYNFELFYNRICVKNKVNRNVFAISEGGRELPILTFGNKNAAEDIIFTARHHCCEATASYALEGVVEALSSGVHPRLLEKFRFSVLPFVDIDGVENGDQGKDRVPHDHNRDYIEPPIYTYTREMYKYTRGKNIAVFIDFHSPYKWGGFDNCPHIHLGKPNALCPSPQDVFCDRLREITMLDAGKNNIVYDNIAYRSPYGGSANKPGTTSSKNYFSSLPGNMMSFTIETPYFGNLEKAYSAAVLYRWGGDIASALDYTLKQIYL